MPGKWEQVVVDAEDPARLARWWAEALGYQIVHEEPGEVEIRLTPETLPGLLFGTVPEPKTVKNRLHLDLRVSQGRTVPRAARRVAIEAAVEAARSRGATLLTLSDNEDVDHVFAVMADPEGNEFCFV